MSATLKPLFATLPAIPGYELIDLIGGGGMGNVYRARQRSLDRLVAIKLLPRSPSRTNSSFFREPRIMAASAHPNVVPVFDCGEADNVSYLVMEYVPGASLRERMHGQPWSLDAAFPIIDDITAALVHLHGCGVLHLDLKPENVLLDAHGRAKIADFGLARGADDPLPPAAPSWGSVDYCPPEQLHALGVDERTDQFALAVIVYELLTGRLPGRIVLPANRWNGALPRRVNAVLEKALRRDPDERYPSVQAFHNALTSAAWGLRRHPLWGSLAALAIAGLVMLPLLLGSGAKVEQQAAPALAPPASPHNDGTAGP